MKGDTISRSALKHQFAEYIAIGDKRFVEGMLHYRKIVLDAIDNAPAVAAAPAVHGKWQFDSGVDYCWKCTECNHTAPSCSGHSDSQDKTLYCPYCGALMDGGEGE